jgi:hypothetical protein
VNEPSTRRKSQYKHTRSIRGAITLTLALTLTGCGFLGGTMNDPGSDVRSRPNGLSTKTKSELLDEAIQQTWDVAQLIGGEWLDDGTPPMVFNLEDREGWSWGSCDKAATTGQYSVSVRQLADASTDFDPESLTEKVRTYWESLGYTIRQIGPSDRDSERYRSINVDLHYKAGLQFSASTRILGIGVQSECAKWD